MTHRKTILGLIFPAILVFGLAACQEGPAESAGERIDRATERAGDSVERAGERVKDSAD